ncbi:hypothetical protein HAX54_000833 [Datura stramonium]|uniref:Condensin complex subunit 1 C-terminal domain-containing protein n=1 Tax=Datura stramonium TaxID=4076 RepID=A0ABS8RS16_DATST|nr:hypothetical protein [Datura stramonium]
MFKISPIMVYYVHASTLNAFQQNSKLCIYHEKAFSNSNFMCKRSNPFMIFSLIVCSYSSVFFLQVVANCLCALQEIWGLEATKSEEASAERETLLSKPLIYYLLNRFKEFSEWAQCAVLELVSKYVPSDSNEIFDMMNLLEDRLQHANGAVVLATIKLFLQLTLSMADIHQQVELVARGLHSVVCSYYTEAGFTMALDTTLHPDLSSKNLMVFTMALDTTP